MRITGRGRRLDVPEQLADDREAKFCPAPTLVRVAQIVNAQALQPCPLHNGAPRAVEVGAWLLVLGAGRLSCNHVGTDTHALAPEGCTRTPKPESVSSQKKIFVQARLERIDQPLRDPPASHGIA